MLQLKTLWVSDASVLCFTSSCIKTGASEKVSETTPDFSESEEMIVLLYTPSKLPIEAPESVANSLRFLREACGAEVFAAQDCI